MHHFQVEGMGCGSCVAKIQHAITALDASATVTVDLPSGQVDVASSQPAPALQAAIVALGFDCHIAAA